jgi:hypothetical protein
MRMQVKVAESARTVISKVRVEDRCKHERFVEQLIDAFLVGLNAHDAVLGERTGTWKAIAKMLRSHHQPRA